MAFPQITEAFLHHVATPEIVERGRAYYEEGRVSALVLRGTTLYAEVEGSEPTISERQPGQKIKRNSRDAPSACHSREDGKAGDRGP